MKNTLIIKKTRRAFESSPTTRRPYDKHMIQNCGGVKRRRLEQIHGCFRTGPRLGTELWQRSSVKKILPRKHSDNHMCV